MRKRRIIINSTMSLLQVIVISGCLFILYRFLLDTLGVEKLGIWSVVLATTSVANVAHLGLSASSVKFVAKYLARGDTEKAAEIVQTSAISVGLVIGIALLAAYPFASWILGSVIPGEGMEAALSILPYALLSLWGLLIAGVFQSGLDGQQRIDLRSSILMTGAVFHLILCFLLVPSRGLMGLAYARIAQAGFVFTGSWLLLRRCLPALPFLPFRWNYKLFREMLAYGVNFQVASISQMLFDPVTKALLTKFGGLHMTGFFEVANRMVMQLRLLLVAANQVIVPAIAELKERSPEVIQKVYRDSYQLMVFIAFPYYSAIIAFTPVVSHVWIGYHENLFVLFSILLSAGWFVNTIIAPAYFTFLGVGELRWNTMGHIAMGVLNFVLGLVFGNLYGGKAVVVACVVSLIVGSLVTQVMYYYRYRLPLIDMMPREHLGIVLASVTGLTVSLLVYQLLSNKLGLLGLSSSVALSFMAIVAVPVWKHPIRSRLLSQLSYLRNKDSAP